MQGLVVCALLGALGCSKPPSANVEVEAGLSTPTGAKTPADLERQRQLEEQAEKLQLEMLNQLSGSRDPGTLSRSDLPSVLDGGVKVKAPSGR